MRAVCRKLVKAHRTFNGRFRCFDLFIGVQINVFVLQIFLTNERMLPGFTRYSISEIRDSIGFCLNHAGLLINQYY